MKRRDYLQYSQSLMAEGIKEFLLILEVSVDYFLKIAKPRDFNIMGDELW
jgi:hypothetical protein